MAENSTCTYTHIGYKYDFTMLQRLLVAQKPRKCVKILLEAPQGLVQYLPKASKLLAECLKESDVCVETAYRLDPSYGSCDIGFEYAKRIGANIIVHLGHTPYLYSYYRSGEKTSQWREAVETLQALVLIPVEYIEAHKKLEQIIEQIRREKIGETIAIGYTAQHRELAHLLAARLKKEKPRVVRVEPVMGCHYYRLVRPPHPDTYILLAGGRFHGLGLALYLYSIGELEKRGVYTADPYTAKLEELKTLAAKTLAKRYAKIYEALRAEKLALIVGVKPGQYRPWVVRELKKLAAKTGKKVDIVASSQLARESLDNLNPHEYDAYITASCPRLAIEDLADYWKPVLTPGEARMILTGRTSRYQFPW